MLPGTASLTPRPGERPAADRPVADLPVVETFHSLQGEGIHAGRSAFFIRLAGCRVGCPWCDTKPSWPQEAHPRRAVRDLAAEAAAAARAGAAFVVLTGGEPLQHDLGPLTDALRAACRLPIHLETSGCDPLSGRIDWITLSPKPHRPPRPELLAACHELKVVVHGPEDLAFAGAMAEAARNRPPPPDSPAPDAAPQLLLQPGWGCRQGQALSLAFVRSHPDWRLSLQSHKWLGVR
jgi:organic radical activating enzyme